MLSAVVRLMPSPRLETFRTFHFAREVVMRGAFRMLSAAIRIAVGLGLPLLTGFTGCGSDSSGPLTQTAKLQLLQADPSVQQPVDLVLDDMVVAQGVAFGNSSAVVATSPGLHRIAIRVGSATGTASESNLGAGQTYFAVSAAGQLFVTHASIGSVVSPDTGQREPNRAHVRFINVTSGADVQPALVNAYLTAPATVDTTAKFQLDTRIASYGPLMYLNPGTITVRFRAPGQSVVLTEVTFAVALGEVKDVILERDASGNLQARVVTEQ
jgi:hypothetical protein